VVNPGGGKFHVSSGGVEYSGRVGGSARNTREIEC